MKNRFAHLDALLLSVTESDVISKSATPPSGGRRPVVEHLPPAHSCSLYHHPLSPLDKATLSYTSFSTLFSFPGLPVSLKFVRLQPIIQTHLFASPRRAATVVHTETEARRIHHGLGDGSRRGRPR
jgi:hypothetical protein